MHSDLARATGLSRLDADVCIIGAGAAGLTTAREFLEAGRSVILLESGGRDFEVFSAGLNAGEIVGRDYYELRGARLRFFGGTTAIWGGRCAELDPCDFEARPWVPGSGWPFGVDELRPWYERARRTLGLAEWVADIADLPGLAAFDAAELQPRLFSFDGRFDRFTFSSCTDVVDHPRCHVVTHATVTKFVTMDERREVTTAAARSLNGRKITVGATHFVLAAGGIENARLLLASGEDGWPGFGNEHDQAGRGFMEHPHGRGGRVVSSRPWRLLSMLGRKLRVGGERVAPLLTPGLDLQRREGVLNSALTLAVRQRAGTREAAGSQIYKHVRHVLDPRQGARRLWKGSKQAAALFRDRTDPLWPWMWLARGRELTLVLRAEQAPNLGSRITLSKRRDALGVPTVRLD